MSLESLTEFIAILGVILTLGAFAGVQLGLLSPKGYGFSGLNLGGASLILLWAAAQALTWGAFAALAWATASGIGLRRAHTDRQYRFSSEELALLAETLPGLGPSSARQLLDAGRWEDAAAGLELSEEGRVIGKLFYISEGSALVQVGGRPVARIESGEFVGELSCLTGRPASATVRLERASRIFSVDASVLRAMSEAKAELRIQLLESMSRDVGQKLRRSNAQVARGLQGARPVAEQARPAGKTARIKD